MKFKIIIRCITNIIKNKMFTKFTLDTNPNIFNELSESIEFENIVNGRKGATLVDYKNDLIPIIRTTTNYYKNDLIPIIRTTTNYNKPTQKFLQLHYDIIENIKKTSKIEHLELNNALIEIYDNQYRKMGYHSDQALDLADNSYICVFSCYDNPTDIRKLKIKDKNTQKESEILMEHNSVIIFSTETNKNYMHKIVLDTNKSQNLWLGVTFRLSKTFIQFINDKPYFYNTDRILRICNQDEKNEFRKLKGDENSKTDHKQIDIDYTISIGDILPIK